MAERRINAFMSFYTTINSQEEFMNKFNGEFNTFVTEPNNNLDLYFPTVENFKIKIPLLRYNCALPFYIINLSHQYFVTMHADCEANGGDNSVIIIPPSSSDPVINSGIKFVVLFNKDNNCYKLVQE